MAKSRKKKGKKKRAKTTLPPVKEAKNDSKISRAKSIPPPNQQKQHRKALSIKKPLRPIEENGRPVKVRKSAPKSTTITESFSKLSIADNEKTKIGDTKRRLSTNTTATNASSGNQKRDKLEHVAKLIKSGKAKNIVIMAGAGISTGSGIPDFRTPGTGLYDNLQKYRIPDPTAIFDLDYFHHDPKPFFTLAKELYPSGKYKPCLPHYLAKLLHDKGLLLRMYTQNIDGLERSAGIPPEKLVEAHGTFSTATCTKCGKKHDGVEIKRKVLDGIIPRCRSSGLCWGIVKPDIVFFGEDLPRRFYYYLRDFPQCDLLIIMGTSLEVEPFAGLTSSVRAYCPRILLNRELVGPFKKKSQRRPGDIGITGDLTEVINRLVNLLEWEKDLEQVIEQAKLDVENESQCDAVSTDSGVSSTEGSPASTKTASLPPPNGDIKRYFHTLRSTPLPKRNSLYVSNSSKDGSYYDYIQKEVCNGKARSNGSVPSHRAPPTIQYTQKMFHKALSSRKVTTFGVRATKSDNESSSDSSSAEEDSSDSVSSEDSSA